MGDFNATPEASELGPVRARYLDAWAEAAAQGQVGGVVSGSTRPSRRVSRIDYVFYAPDVDLRLESVDVVDPSTLPGLDEVSDHYLWWPCFTESPHSGGRPNAVASVLPRGAVARSSGRRPASGRLDMRQPARTPERSSRHDRAPSRSPPAPARSASAAHPPLPGASSHSARWTRYSGL
jgi:hypothetical protein